MSRLLDTALCPDCRSTIGPDATCTGCGLRLMGPLATQLWNTMVRADSLVEQLRAAPVPATAAEPSPTSPPAFPVPPSPVAAPIAPRPVLGGRAVPALLLALGGLLVFVAVSLFLAVTWTLLPLAVKALIMIVVTASLVAVAAVLSHHGLRGSAETFWGLGAALLVLDLTAAYRADLAGLGSLPDHGIGSLIGVVLAAMGIGGGLWLRRTPLRYGIATSVIAGIGLLVLTEQAAWTGRFSGGSGALVATLVLLGLAYGLHRVLRAVALTAAGIGALSWLVTVGAGLDRIDDLTRTEAWSRLQTWPILATVAVAALATVAVARITALHRARAWLPVVCASATLADASLLLLLPVLRPTPELLWASGALLVLAAVAALAPRPWSLGGSIVGGTGGAIALLAVVVEPIALVTRFVDTFATWTHGPSVHLATLHQPNTWVLLPLAVGALAVAAATARSTDQRFVLVVTGTVAPLLLGLALVSCLAGNAAPLWILVALLSVVSIGGTVGCGLVADQRARLAAAVISVEAALLALVLATRSDEVSAVLAGIGTVVAAAWFAQGRARDGLGAPLALAVATVLLGYTVATGGLAADARPVWIVVLVAISSAAGFLSAAPLARTGAQRIAAEAAAGVVGVAAVFLGISDADWIALALTIVGSALALTAVANLDRAVLGWVASGVLFVSTLVRLVTDDRIPPELYALPAAVVLLAAGAYRLLRQPELGSWRVLGSGLTLALVPSLLLAMDDPSSWRSTFVLLAGAVALGVGLVRHWQAPFLVGGAVLGVLALRFLLPLAAQILANPLGAWMLFGAIGSSLLAAGVLWEQSLRRLRSAAGFVAELA